MNDSVIIEVDWTDFSRDAHVPISNLYAWAQRCRHKSFSSGMLRELLSTTNGQLMVKAQQYHVVGMFQFGTSTIVEVKQRISSVGKTSITLLTEFFAKNERFAFGHVAIVSVKHGKVDSIPKSFLELLTKNVLPDPHAGDLKRIGALIAESATHPIEAEHQVRLRSSDEDSNSHVNQAKYALFFEDALQLVEDIPVRLHSLFCDYVRESRRGQTCAIKVRRTSAGSALLQMYRGDELICNGFATWKPPQSL